MRFIPIIAFLLHINNANGSCIQPTIVSVGSENRLIEAVIDQDNKFSSSSKYGNYEIKLHGLISKKNTFSYINVNYSEKNLATGDTSQINTALSLEDVQFPYSMQISGLASCSSTQKNGETYKNCENRSYFLTVKSTSFDLSSDSKSKEKCAFITPSP